MLREARLTSAPTLAAREALAVSRPAHPPRSPRTDTSASNKYVGTGAAMVLVLGLLVAKFSGPPDFSYEGSSDKTLSEYVQAFK